MAAQLLLAALTAGLSAIAVARPRYMSFTDLQNHGTSMESLHSATKAHARGPVMVPYIPEIGVANVTKPTELPPPPPTLDPYTDFQPFDTAVGNWIASSFLAPPTVSPPPSQAALDLANGCPAMLNFPNTVNVVSPKQCSSGPREAAWTNTTKGPVLTYQESCAPVESVQPVTTYTLGDGQVFGYSKTRFSFTGNQMEMLDCNGELAFLLEEKIYHQTKVVNKASCDTYKSCDGTVFLQYFLYNKYGRKIAETPFLNLFQNKITISSIDEKAPIADMSKDWSPWTVCSDEMSSSEPTKEWLVSYFPGAPGIFSDVVNRWPIAMMATIIAQRDQNRRANGMVTPTKCEIFNIVVLSLIAFAGLGLVTVGVVYFYKFLLEDAQRILHNVEMFVFPKAMYKPTKWDG